MLLAHGSVAGAIDRRCSRSSAIDLTAANLITVADVHLGLPQRPRIRRRAGSVAAASGWSRYRKRVPCFVPLGSPSPSPSISSESTSDFFGKLEFNDGFGGLAVIVTLLLAFIGFVVWCVRAFRKRKDEARLVTSKFKLRGNGMNIPYTYEISVHNATPHPLSMVEVRYWNGTEWRPMPVRSSQNGDFVISPGDMGIVAVPAMTTSEKFNSFYFLRYEDSHKRIWNRLINSPDFLSCDDVRQLERFHWNHPALEND